ncbi:MAG: hypothetical protein GYA59_12180 [Chloroflexi bacterium]|jgi:hypothetical protein|nr:hypothetical protein [Chloroflexota bacterium]
MSGSFKSVAKYILVMLAVVVLAACGGAPAEPTLDPNEVYTQAAETVQAQLAETAAAQPSPTTAPTNTPQPTKGATQIATATILPGFQLTAMPGSQLTALPGSTQAGIPTSAVAATTAVVSLPTATRPAGQKVGDAAQWAYNVPADGSSVSAGEEFMLEIGISNIGSTTWTTDYTLQYVGGTQLSGITVFNLENETKPGEKGVFNIWARAPGDLGQHSTYFNFFNGSGTYIYQVYFAFNVN